MKTIAPAEARFYSRLLLLVFALCAGSFPLSSQNGAQPPGSGKAAAPASPVLANASALQAPTHSTTDLAGPWRFKVGDDPRWADPAYDDSAWGTVTLGKPLSEQGFDSYTGYGWYRLRLAASQPSQLAHGQSDEPLSLLVTSRSVGQLAVYINGADAGRTRGMHDQPTMYQSTPFIVHVARADDPKATVIAIRSWAGADLPIQHGLLDKVELGSHADIAERLAQTTARQWNEHVTAGLILTFLFLCVAVLGATLYLAQRNHSEYLWLALLCLSVAITGADELLFGQALLSLPVFKVLELWTGRFFMAATLEFILRFTASDRKRTVRGVQIYVLLLPIVSLLQFQQLYEILSITAEVVFCAVAAVLLFQAWRRGRREAGVMLLPFLLAATADSADTILDYLASRHWIGEKFASNRFHFGPTQFGTSSIAYSIFLASVMAVILYRFIRVSQEEQRSAAEIEAARSVQALLIPTHLPSNRHFMLESAYLPANGVGGDFFQVLPLKDDSMLIVVGDVSGKGLQAAMSASTLVGALRNELSHDPATILDHLNLVMLGAVAAPSTIAQRNSVASFATCLCARIYPSGMMSIANAGHLSPYRDGREMELASGLPLGIVADIAYEQANFQLNQGDRLVFLSDGVIEATNAQGELFGFERTQQVSHEPALYIAQTAQRFGQCDDITVVSLYVASRAADRGAREPALTH